jgi:hypothetical protein
MHLNAFIFHNTLVLHVTCLEKRMLYFASCPAHQRSVKQPFPFGAMSSSYQGFAMPYEAEI